MSGTVRSQRSVTQSVLAGQGQPLRPKRTKTAAPQAVAALLMKRRRMVARRSPPPTKTGGTILQPILEDVAGERRAAVADRPVPVRRMTSGSLNRVPFIGSLGSNTPIDRLQELKAQFSRSEATLQDLKAKRSEFESTELRPRFWTSDGAARGRGLCLPQTPTATPSMRPAVQQSPTTTPSLMGMLAKEPVQPSPCPTPASPVPRPAWSSGRHALGDISNVGQGQKLKGRLSTDGPGIDLLANKMRGVLNAQPRVNSNVQHRCIR